MDDAVFHAAGRALAAGIALPIGAALGLFVKPARQTVAMIMAFGSGALIEALSLDLAFEGAEALVLKHQMGEIPAWTTVAVGFLAGGILFLLADHALEGHGGHLRKPSTFRAFVRRNRHRFAERLHRHHAARLVSLVEHGPRRVHEAEHEVVWPAARQEHGASAPVAILLGALLDGIPESMVIGAQPANFDPTFVVAVFLSNLPEAMSSAAGMERGGFSARRILGIWTGVMMVSAAFGAIGNIVLTDASPIAATFANAVAGGAVLAMLSSTMVPEAFEEGGPSVSLATIAGFLATFLLTTTKIAERGG